MNRKAYYGEFGGQYVAESLMNTLEELDAAFEEAVRDPEFLKQYHYYLLCQASQRGIRHEDLLKARGLKSHRGSQDQ